MKLKELSELEKPYYGSGTHYENYATFKDFYSEMKDFDIDMNLVYRFDVNFDYEDEYYYLQIYTILQRKGRVTEHFIDVVEQDDLKLLEEYLKPHQDLCGKLIGFKPTT